MKIDWHARAQALNIDGRALINGERVWAANGARFDNFSPIDGHKLGEVARCDERDVELAVQAARTAFDDKRWAGMPPSARKRVFSTSWPPLASNCCSNCCM